MPHKIESDSVMPSSPPVLQPMADSSQDVMDTTRDEMIQDDVDLLELFDDKNIDEDDEFAVPTSSAIANGMSNLSIPSSPPQLPPQIDNKSRFSDPDIMLAFYRRLFPFRTLYQWLNHGIKPSVDMANRELAFNLRGDIYLRYQSYTTGDLFRKDVLRQNPTRFEIGPVYNTNPRDRKSLRQQASFKPVAKELCFDLDLTDYDEIRTCCSEANICLKCWQWATMAVKVVDTCLRDDFGFEHIIWVYSGRRGVHGWVCDKRAREMGDDKRRAIAAYLAVVTGSSKSASKVAIRRPLHPHIKRSLEILEPYFAKDVLRNQDPWRAADKTERLLELIPDKLLVAALKRKWDSAPDRSSTSKWEDINAMAEKGVSEHLDTKALFDARQDIILEYTYPRLDIEVSKKLNHLLKSPFVVHPGTGRVCVPIPIPSRTTGSEDWTALENFNPLTVPTVIDLLNEIDTWDSQELEKQDKSQDDPETSQAGPETITSSAGKMQDYEKTSLKPYVNYFKSFVADMIKTESRSVKREREDDEVPVKAEPKSDTMEF